jgi:hypothetical protein
VTSAEWSSPQDSDRTAPGRSGDAVPGDAVPGDAVPGDAVPGDAVPGAPQDDERPQRSAEPGPAVADLAELGTLDERPLAEHADVFGRVHAQLQAALAEVDGS